MSIANSDFTTWKHQQTQEFLRQGALYNSQVANTHAVLEAVDDFLLRVGKSPAKSIHWHIDFEITVPTCIAKGMISYSSESLTTEVTLSF